MALIPVDHGQIAALVTHLAMDERPKRAPQPTSPLRLAHWKAPDPAKYRILFQRIGEPWLWFSRLVIPDAALCAIIQDRNVEVHAVLDPRGIEIGLLELDFREEARCDVAFLGLAPQLIGQGLGGWLVASAIALGWRAGTRRMTVRTATTDDPRALPLYIKAGFAPVRREIELFDDPRLNGILPLTAAPHIPLLRTTR